MSLNPENISAPVSRSILGEIRPPPGCVTTLSLQTTRSSNIKGGCPDQPVSAEMRAGWEDTHDEIGVTPPSSVASTNAPVIPALSASPVLRCIRRTTRDLKRSGLPVRVLATAPARFGADTLAYYTNDAQI
jgi:hypothetical protein